MKEVYVGHQYLYDFRFQARNGLLTPQIYIFDFLDYVMAGIAFNELGQESSAHKISEFVSVYRVITGEKEAEEADKIRINKMITTYYTDLVNLYRDNFRSFKQYCTTPQSGRGRGARRSQKNPILAGFENGSIEAILQPSFESVKDVLTDLGFETLVVHSKNYVSQNDAAVRSHLDYAAVVKFPTVYENFSILFDHSDYVGVMNAVLLEVINDESGI